MGQPDSGVFVCGGGVLVALCELCWYHLHVIEKVSTTNRSPAR